MREFLPMMMQWMQFHGDDQLAWIQLALSFPQTVSIDFDQKYFLCAYKEENDAIEMDVDGSGALVVGGGETSIGLVHYNSGMTAPILGEK
jgi:hypothetical protein